MVCWVIARSKEREFSVIKYDSWAIMVLMRISTYLVICYVAQVLREVLMVKWLRISNENKSGCESSY